MGEKMALEDVRDWHRKTAREKDVCGELRFPGPNESPFYRYPSDESKAHDAMADAIDAHLTQPAQAVDVEHEMALAFRAGAKWADEHVAPDGRMIGKLPEPRVLTVARASNEYAGERLTAALPNANGKERQP